MATKSEHVANSGSTNAFYKGVVGPAQPHKAANIASARATFNEQRGSRQIAHAEKTVGKRKGLPLKGRRRMDLADTEWDDLNDYFNTPQRLNWSPLLSVDEQAYLEYPFPPEKPAAHLGKAANWKFGVFVIWYKYHFSAERKMRLAELGPTRVDENEWKRIKKMVEDNNKDSNNERMALPEDKPRIPHDYSAWDITTPHDIYEALTNQYFDPEIITAAGPVYKVADRSFAPFIRKMMRQSILLYRSGEVPPNEQTRCTYPSYTKWYNRMTPANRERRKIIMPRGGADEHHEPTDYVFDVNISWPYLEKDGKVRTLLSSARVRLLDTAKVVDVKLAAMERLQQVLGTAIYSVISESAARAIPLYAKQKPLSLNNDLASYGFGNFTVVSLTGRQLPGGSGGLKFSTILAKGHRCFEVVDATGMRFRFEKHRSHLCVGYPLVQGDPPTMMWLGTGPLPLYQLNQRVVTRLDFEDVSIHVFDNGVAWAKREITEVGECPAGKHPILTAEEKEEMAREAQISQITQELFAREFEQGCDREALREDIEGTVRLAAGSPRAWKPDVDAKITNLRKARKAQALARLNKVIRDEQVSDNNPYAALADSDDEEDTRSEDLTDYTREDAPASVAVEETKDGESPQTPPGDAPDNWEDIEIGETIRVITPAELETRVGAGTTVGSHDIVAEGSGVAAAASTPHDYIPPQTQPGPAPKPPPERVEEGVDGRRERVDSRATRVVGNRHRILQPTVQSSVAPAIDTLSQLRLPAVPNVGGGSVPGYICIVHCSSLNGNYVGATHAQVISPIPRRKIIKDEGVSVLDCTIRDIAPGLPPGHWPNLPPDEEVHLITEVTDFMTRYRLRQKELLRYQSELFTTVGEPVDVIIEPPNAIYLLQRLERLVAVRRISGTRYMVMYVSADASYAGCCVLPADPLVYGNSERPVNRLTHTTFGINLVTQDSPRQYLQTAYRHALSAIEASTNLNTSHLASVIAELNRTCKLRTLEDLGIASATDTVAYALSQYRPEVYQTALRVHSWKFAKDTTPAYTLRDLYEIAKGHVEEYTTLLGPTGVGFIGGVSACLLLALPLMRRAFRASDPILRNITPLPVRLVGGVVETVVLAAMEELVKRAISYTTGWSRYAVGRAYGGYEAIIKTIQYGLIPGAMWSLVGPRLHARWASQSLLQGIAEHFLWNFTVDYIAIRETEPPPPIPHPDAEIGGILQSIERKIRDAQQVDYQGILDYFTPKTNTQPLVEVAHAYGTLVSEQISSITKFLAKVGAAACRRGVWEANIGLLGLVPAVVSVFSPGVTQCKPKLVATTKKCDFDEGTGHLTFHERFSGIDSNSLGILKRARRAYTGFVAPYAYYYRCVDNLESAVLRYSTAAGSGQGCNGRLILERLVTDSTPRAFNLDWLEADTASRLPHPKRQLRLQQMQAFRDNPDDWFVRRDLNEGKMKIELRGKYRKKPRLFVNIGEKQIVKYSFIYDYAKKELARLLYRHEVLPNHYLTFAYGWNTTTMTDELNWALRYDGKHAWVFSDDILLFDVTNGIPTICHNVDISNCDQSHTWEHFAVMMRFMMQIGCPRDLTLDSVRDNFSPVKINHPDGGRFGSVTFYNRGRIGLCSGYAGTTLINSLWSSISVITMWESKTDAKSAFARQGFDVTVDSGEFYRKAIFLRHVPLRVEGLDHTFVWAPCASIMLTIGQTIKPITLRDAEEHLDGVLVGLKTHPLPLYRQLANGRKEARQHLREERKMVEIGAVAVDAQFDSYVHRYDFDDRILLQCKLVEQVSRVCAHEPPVHDEVANRFFVEDYGILESEHTPVWDPMPIL